jgi:hypothetical protein
MANRFPLIVDTADGNKFKELPLGDNLDLSGSGIVNASSIEVNGNLDVQSLTVNQQTLSAVAVSGDYNDLNNVPVSFSGSYNDLSNKPTIPTLTKNLTDVSITDPTDGQILVFNATAGVFEPKDQTDIDLSGSSINGLQDVITTGVTELKYLKYQSGAWRPGNINYSEILNKPTNVSSFINDSGYLDATVFAAENEITNEATNTYNGNNEHNGFEVFNNRVDFFGTVNIDTENNTVINSQDLILTPSNALTIQSNGLLIEDDGAGRTTISDNDSELGINFGGTVRFDEAVIEGIGDILLGAVEATSFKGNLIANNLNETVIVDASTEAGVFVNLDTDYLNVQSRTAPTTNVGQSGDRAGDVIFGQDQGGATKYMYYCGSDYDGVTAIWYRTQMTSNWE